MVGIKYSRGCMIAHCGSSGGENEASMRKAFCLYYKPEMVGLRLILAICHPEPFILQDKLREGSIKS